MQASPEEPGAKKRRTFFGKHAKCGQCHTCLHPALKRACMVNRPPEIAAAAHLSRNKSNTKALASGGPYAGGGGGGGATGIASAAEFLAARVDWPDDKPVPAHGVSGFKLPIDPQTRAKKWTRAWCVCPRAGSGNEAVRLTHDVVFPSRRRVEEGTASGTGTVWLLRWQPGVCCESCQHLRRTEQGLLTRIASLVQLVPLTARLRLTGLA